jgi:DNA-binding LytR/AlgR family response regulator
VQQSLKYIIVDDDEIDRLTIETEAARFPFLVRIASCSHALEAFELISRFHPDIVFADIEMPGMSGIELIRKLSGQVAAPVFITSFPEYALEGYEMDIFDYLLKPLSRERFASCAQRLSDFCELRAKAFAFDKDQDEDTMIVKQGHEKTKLRIQDILYLEAMKDYTRIITGSGQLLVLSTLNGMLEKLPRDKFIRIHRSYVVNREKIQSVKGNKIHLAAHELPVGKLYKSELNTHFQ